MPLSRVSETGLCARHSSEQVGPCHGEDGDTEPGGRLAVASPLDPLALVGWTLSARGRARTEQRVLGRARTRHPERDRRGGTLPPGSLPGHLLVPGATPASAAHSLPAWRRRSKTRTRVPSANSDPGGFRREQFCKRFYRKYRTTVMSRQAEKCINHGNADSRRPSLVARTKCPLRQLLPLWGSPLPSVCAQGSLLTGQTLHLLPPVLLRTPQTGSEQSSPTPQTFRPRRDWRVRNILTVRVLLPFFVSPALPSDTFRSPPHTSLLLSRPEEPPASRGSHFTETNVSEQFEIYGHIPNRERLPDAHPPHTLLRSSLRRTRLLHVLRASECTAPALQLTALSLDRPKGRRPGRCTFYNTLFRLCLASPTHLRTDQTPLSLFSSQVRLRPESPQEHPPCSGRSSPSDPHSWP